MKKLIFAVTLLMTLPIASVAMAKPLHPPVMISDVHFEEGPNGEQIAVSQGNPGIFDEFERPVLCSPIGDPAPEAICGSPSVFMERGGKVKLWRELWKNDSLANQERGAIDIATGKLSPSYEAYYVMESPPHIFYCIYPFDSEASFCRLFPDDNSDIKVGDQFASCYPDSKSWNRDKDGIPYDCGGSAPILNREVKFIVQNVSDEEIFLRAIVSNSFPLNSNGRINVMGLVTGKTVFMLIKLREAPKAKAKSSKTKKK